MPVDTRRPPRPLDKHRAHLMLLARDRARKLLNSPLDPADAVQEALLKAHAKRDQFRGCTDGDLAAWLRAILANTLAEAGRRHGGPRRRVPFEEVLGRGPATRLAGGDPGPLHHAQHNELLRRLAESLDRLPGDQRVALTLRHIGGCPVAEVARQMRRTPFAVAGLLRRGLCSLREWLRECD